MVTENPVAVQVEPCYTVEFPPFNIQSVLYDIQYGIKNPTTRQQHKPSLKQMSARTRTRLKTARSEREMLQALQTVRVSNVHTWVQTKVKTVKNT